MMTQNIHQRLRSTRLIWADKIALLLAILFSSLLLCLWLLAFLVVETPGPGICGRVSAFWELSLEALAIGSSLDHDAAARFRGGGAQPSAFLTMDLHRRKM